MTIAREVEERTLFAPARRDRWLQIFHDTVNGGWIGPNATVANKRATGMAWAMAQRSFGQGAGARRPAGRG
jgi:hypothetical protein